jgi:hypothetical protein
MINITKRINKLKEIIQARREKAEKGLVPVKPITIEYLHYEVACFEAEKAGLPPPPEPGRPIKWVPKEDAYKYTMGFLKREAKQWMRENKGMPCL